MSTTNFLTNATPKQHAAFAAKAQAAGHQTVHFIKKKKKPMKKVTAKQAALMAAKLKSKKKMPQFDPMAPSQDMGGDS